MRALVAALERIATALEQLVPALQQSDRTLVQTTRVLAALRVTLQPPYEQATREARGVEAEAAKHEEQLEAMDRLRAGVLTFPEDGNG